MDAITMLRNDHRDVQKLFRQVESTTDAAQLERLGAQIIEMLSVHASIEEQVFYPAVEQALPRSASAVLKSLEAHHAAKSILAEVDRLTPGSDRYQPKLLVLIDNVRTHIAEEEQDMFPKLRDALGRKQLDEIGDLMDQARKLAPTKPHPHAPDTAPQNYANIAVGIVDRARSAGENVVRNVANRVSGGGSKKSTTKKSAVTAKKTVAKKAASGVKKATKATKTTKKR
jgi:hemerythrin superfamily protein